MYFLTMEITRRRFASTIFVRASCPRRRTVRRMSKSLRNSSGGMPNTASYLAILPRTSFISASRFLLGRDFLSAARRASCCLYGRNSFSSASLQSCSRTFCLKLSLSNTLRSEARTEARAFSAAFISADSAGVWALTRATYSWLAFASLLPISASCLRNFGSCAMYASRLSSNLSVTTRSKRSSMCSSLSRSFAYIFGANVKRLKSSLARTSASSIRMHISTSCSRVRSGTCPIWCRYMRMGSSIVSPFLRRLGAFFWSLFAR